MRKSFSRFGWGTLFCLAVLSGACSDDTNSNNASNNSNNAQKTDSGTTDSGAIDPTDATDKLDAVSPTDATNQGDTNVPPIEEGCINHYQRICDEQCVNIKVDPDNCGACGTECAADEACAGGACSATCGKNEQICDRSCVDTKSDSNHCGTCGTVCDDGKGCNAGVCVPAIDLSQARACEGGGPPVQFDWDGEQDRCSGNVAEAAFRWAMCGCSDTSLTGGLKTDAFDSTLGPYVPGILGGGVGINGTLKSTQNMDIGGSLWVGDTSTGALNAQGIVHIDLRVGGRASITGGLQVSGDAAVGSYNAGGSTFAVGRTLTVPAGATMGGIATYQDLQRAPVNVPMPCACDAEQIIPIAAMVEGARTKNDNALIDLDANALSAVNAPRRLDLPCGNYFLNGINVGADITIMAHGRTALYIKGSVTSQHLTIKAMPGAEIDVFIDGEVHTGGLVFGSQHFPAATRLYLGGAEGLKVTKDVNIGGFVYAYPGVMHITQDVDVYGGIFANELIVNAPLAIHYDRQIQRVGDSCPGTNPDPDPDPNPDADAGTTPDAGPGSDASTPGSDASTPGDTGTTPDPGNQCVRFEGACGSSSDCCAPLLCDQGTCGVNRCLVTGESCVYDSDCCGQICAKASGATNGVCIAN